LTTLRDLIADLITDHWAKLLSGVALFLVGRYFGRWRAGREWRRREFMHRLMVTLNSIQPGENGAPTLQIRTLIEKDLSDVLLNSAAVAKVTEAAAKTSERDPVLPVAKEDRWFLLNSVLNEIAERFAPGTMAKDQGVPVTSYRYLICLTNEVAGSIRTHKVRAMVARKDLLTSGAFDQGLALESPNHSTRIETLRHMRTRYAQEPDLFLEMEIALPR
jgi:hypothetical protein